MEKENVKMIVSILIVMILLIICAAVTYTIFIIPREEVIETVGTEESSEKENTEFSNNEIKEKSINISVIGDIMCHNTQYNDAYNPATGNYDFSYVFEDIKKYIEKADLAVGNLETTFAGKEKGYSSYPTFNTPDALASNLKELGLDVLSTANNHSLDSGYKGVERTIEVLDNLEIDHVGTYASTEDSEKILIKEVNDIRIAFLSYTYGTNGIPVPKGREYCINLISDEKIISDAKKAKDENVDLIITIIHWGQEYQTSSNNEQKRLMNLLYENGVDLIFGSHPHVLQEMGKHDIKNENGTERQGFTIFSLGNFVSGQVKENTKQSIILNLDVTKKSDGTISIDNINYVPIYTYEKNRTKKYKILDIKKEIAIYEDGDKRIGEPFYNTLKKELEHIYTILPKD